MPTITEERLKQLIYKYLAGNLTETENQELTDCGAAHPEIWELVAQLEDEDQLIRDLRRLQRIHDREKLGKTPFLQMPVWRLVAAIFILAVVFTGAIFYLKHQRQPEIASLPRDTAITTGFGRRSLNLPDGSKVLLSSASTLHYPSAFTGPNREVSLTGEALFEVAGNASRPFFVKVNGVTVQVLGTTFNIRAYHDDSTVTTTLLDGLVKIRYGKREQLLQPKDQVVVNPQKNSWDSRKDIEAAEVLSWKNGGLTFVHADIPTVMRELARWFDIEVKIEVPADQHIYDGTFNLSSGLPDILHRMTNKDIHFINEGKKIIVTK